MAAFSVRVLNTRTVLTVQEYTSIDGQSYGIYQAQFRAGDETEYVTWCPPHDDLPAPHVGDQVPIRYRVADPLEVQQVSGFTWTLHALFVGAIAIMWVYMAFTREYRVEGALGVIVLIVIALFLLTSQVGSIHGNDRNRRTSARRSSTDQ